MKTKMSSPLMRGISSPSKLSPPLTLPYVVNKNNRLVSHKENRLGKGKRGLQELKDHPFFKAHDIDWNNLRGSKEPPFLPRLDSSLDTAYFADHQEQFHDVDEPASPLEIEVSPGKLRRVESNFVGFTYEHKGHMDEMFTDLEESGLLTPDLLATLGEMKKNHQKNLLVKRSKEMGERLDTVTEDSDQ